MSDTDIRKGENIKKSVLGKVRFEQMSQGNEGGSHVESGEECSR